MNNVYFSIEFQSKDEKNVLTLLLTVFVACYGLGILFLACELSQRLVNAFTEIDRMIEQFDWYLFPLNIQRMLPIIIVVAQEPVNLECFGSISCNRAVFKKVCFVAHFLFRSHGNVRASRTIKNCDYNKNQFFWHNFLGRQYRFLVFYDAPSNQQMSLSVSNSAPSRNIVGE